VLGDEIKKKSSKILKAKVKKKLCHFAFHYYNKMPRTFNMAFTTMRWQELLIWHLLQ
jgi:hypothetical protein